MTNKNDSAYPVIVTRPSIEDSYVSEGLTKREYFAIMILQGLMANPERYKYISKKVENDTTRMSQKEATRKNVHKAVLIADALIEELSTKAIEGK